jgi:dihydroorotate dehydrogenase/Pyruvate/2-oxoacid:ferredoxin oxidoreductase delta subunit
MMVDFSTTYLGVPIKNPFILGGGPATATPEICEKAAKAGWAGLVLKTNFADDAVERVMADSQVPYKAPRPYYKLVNARGMDKWRPPAPEATAPRSSTGKLGQMPKDYMVVTCMQLTTSPFKIYAGPQSWYNGDEGYLYLINKTKELVKGTDCKVIPGVFAFTEKGWDQQCNLINKSNADMVELCLGAPAGVVTDPITGKPTIMGASPEHVEKWTRYCVQRLKIPVGVDIPPYCQDPLASIQAAMSAGAKGVSFGDCPTVKPLSPPLVIDPDTLEVGFAPGVPFRAATTQTWGLPYICGPVAHFKMSGVEIDISGSGGVRDYRDVVRLLMAGASSAHICSAAIVEGVEICAELQRDMEAWMEHKGYNSVKEIQGIIIDKDKLKIDPSKFDADVAQVAGGPTPNVRVEVTKEKCIDCRWCESACFFLAIKMEAQAPVIDDKLCEVCGMCVAVCPTEALCIEPRISTN